jgi:hypothetical protein
VYLHWLLHYYPPAFRVYGVSVLHETCFKLNSVKNTEF